MLKRCEPLTVGPSGQAGAGSRMQQTWEPASGVNRRGGAKPRGRNAMNQLVAGSVSGRLQGMSDEGHTASNESHERQVIGARVTATTSSRTNRAALKMK